MSKRARISALPGLCLIASAVAAMAAEPAPTTVAEPVTGALLGATAEDLARITAANPIPARDDAAVSVTVQPDGTRSAILDDSFLATSVVRIGPDGKPIVGCVTSREEYEAFFAADAAPAVPAAEVR